jgi:hypothetical protein
MMIGNLALREQTFVLLNKFQSSLQIAANISELFFKLQTITQSR